MGILKDSQMIFYADSKYDLIYDSFTKKETENKLDIKSIYLLAATVGFKNSRRVKVEKRGKETRTSYLSYKEEGLLLNMVFSDSEIDNNIDEIVNSSNKVKIKGIIEEYANGGMELIVEKALFHRWNGNDIDNGDGNLVFDLSKYILAEINDIPF